MEKYYTILSQCPLFHGIEKENIPMLIKRLKGTIKQYKKNDYIRLCNDKADFIGIVLEGQIQIIQDDFYGNRTIISSIAPPRLFAESFVCSGVKALPVDILASEDSTIVFIESKNIFVTCGGGCEFHHIIISNLLQIVARKNLELNRKLVCVSNKTTKDKILSYLHTQENLHNSKEFDIPFNRGELAHYLGVERSAMSTELNKLVKEGIIETKNKHFKLI